MSAADADSTAVNNFQLITANRDALSRHPNSAAFDAVPSLKRPASPDIGEEKKSRKRKKDGMDRSGNVQVDMRPTHSIDGQALVDDLAQELQCGCCAGLVYKPVTVIPCDHFFCGSCCTLWVKNGGTNCPACRSVSTAVMPSRPLQSMVDVLIRAAPHLQRTERERTQADEIYPTLRPFRIPVPREPSPEPEIPPISDFVRPCPHCAPNNPFHWSCPQPIADPATDPDSAWRIDAGPPPGHSFCGNCETVLALQAPSTTRCDFCLVSFCGINVQGRCIALPIAAQTPHGMSDVGDLIQTPEIYDCFEGNTIEVELMLDYMTNQRLSPKHIYRQITAHILSQPDGFRPLIEQELFMDMHTVPGGADQDPNAPRRLICRLCATEVFLYGLRDWWIRERRKAVEEGKLQARKDCPDGALCDNINDPAHGKGFNHLLASGNTEPPPQPGTSTPSASSSNTALSTALSTEILPVPPPGRSSLFLPPISSDEIPSPTADLPSFSNLVADLARPPRFNLPSDIFARFIPGGSNERHEEEQRAPVTAPLVDLHARPPAQSSNRTADLDIEADDEEIREPSSSQSVEAQLTENVLVDYGSEPGSDAEDKRAAPSRMDMAAGASVDADADADAQLEAYYSATRARSEMNVPEIRRTQSPSKIEPDMDVSMADARASAFASLHFLQELGFGTNETDEPHASSSYTVPDAPPASSAYPLRVE